MSNQLLIDWLVDFWRCIALLWFENTTTHTQLYIQHSHSPAGAEAKCAPSLRSDKSCRTSVRSHDARFPLPDCLRLPSLWSFGLRSLSPQMLTTNALPPPSRLGDYLFVPLNGRRGRWRLWKGHANRKYPSGCWILNMSNKQKIIHKITRCTLHCKKGCCQLKYLITVHAAGL